MKTEIANVYRQGDIWLSIRVSKTYPKHKIKRQQQVFHTCHPTTQTSHFFNGFFVLNWSYEQKNNETKI